MKLSLVLSAFALVLSPLFAVQDGDSYRQVVEEKGLPMSKMEAGGVLILKYPDSVIKLRDDKVVSIAPAGESATIKSSSGAVPRSVPSVGAGQWTTDYAAALRQAKADKRLVFVFFTGSDWCGWCKRLDGEILSTGEFKAFARERLILVKIDFPRAVPLPAAALARNEKLAREFQVTGFPTVMVLDSAGKSVGRFGYQEGGPRPFVTELKKL